MSNRLNEEQSLYLKQHQDNPVHWWPFSNEAFEEAQKLNKPILISIGYSSCHWCHVMAHECFEDEYIADIMNKNFICIKVDREERPDVDQVYMEAVQMINQHGGWPLNVFCLPDGKPFFGGTYFPPEDRGNGIIPFPQLLTRISEHFEKAPEELQENAENILKNLVHSNTPRGSGLKKLDGGRHMKTLNALLERFDAEWGGFGSAPKFPPSMILDYLLTLRLSNALSADQKLADSTDEAIYKTLHAMAHGGLFDQIGGGFSRYSVDKFWVIPHFEKMLYDNALLIDIYSKGYQRYQDELFKCVVEESIEFLVRDMQLPSGLFAASIDADSEGVEGLYYTWTPEQVEEILGAGEAKIFCDAYHITEKGNFENNTTLPCWVYQDDAKRAALAPMRKKLLAARQERIAPTTDPKGLLAWNALLIRGLSQAAFTFKNLEWFELAQKAADVLWEVLRSESGALKSVFYEGTAKVDAFLDDYAYLAHAYLTLASHIEFFKPGSATEYVGRARELADYIHKHFADPQRPGCYFTPEGHDSPVTRKKVWWDNALPSGNSTLAHVLGQLYGVTGEERYRAAFGDLAKVYADLADDAPAGVPFALNAFATDLLGLAVIKYKDAESLGDLHTALLMRPHRVALLVHEPVQDKAFQLCVGTQCLEPVETVGDLLQDF